MREPKWSSGAYSVVPRLLETGRDNSTSHLPRALARDPIRLVAYAAVESWAGTREELLSVVVVLVNQAPPGEALRMSAFIGTQNGRSSTAKTLDELTNLIARTESADLLVLRVDLQSPDEMYGATVVATPRTPGLRIQVWGPEQSRSLGAAQLAFRRMMAGYVDRLGGWRAPTWMVSALAPLLLFGIGVSPGAANPWARAAVIIASLVSSVAVFLFSYRRLLVPGGFEILEQVPANRANRLKRAFSDPRAHRWIRRLVPLAAALAVGVIGNKLSDLIPWP